MDDPVLILYPLTVLKNARNFSETRQQKRGKNKSDIQNNDPQTH